MQFAFVALLALLPKATEAIDNGLGLTPPLGWRSYNAFGGSPTQVEMEATMDLMVDKSRMVDGKPTSLLELGYNHVGLDGGWNYCFPENHTFHWASDGRPVWNSAFPDPKHMVTKAHGLGLSPGWYLNNCGCAENHFDEAMVDKVMRGSVKMLADQGWDGVKFDSCSMMHNLTKWAALINQTGRPVLIENCFQGAYAPGEQQWQGYIKNSSEPSGYTNYLGMFYGMGTTTVLANVTFQECEAHCNANTTERGGFTFVGMEPKPRSVLSECYVMSKADPHPMDMSNNNYCNGDSDPSDCPFNFYRVSGDISSSFGSMLANLAYTVPFFGQGGVHLPFPQDPVVRSRPGGWAYPDMLEVGNLANATEDRTHFGAWAVISSPLILSFNLNNTAKLDRAWPIITNKAVLAVNQRWAGNPGRRVTLATDGSWQAWAKPLGKSTYAVFLMSTSDTEVSISLPMANVSSVFAKSGVCLKDLYSGKTLSMLQPEMPLQIQGLAVHDSAMYCAFPSDANTACAQAAIDNCP